MLLTKPLAILICACLYRLVLGTLLSFSVGKMTATVFLAEMRYSVYLLYRYNVQLLTQKALLSTEFIATCASNQKQASKKRKKNNARVLLAKNIGLMLNISNVTNARVLCPFVKFYAGECCKGRVFLFLQHM
jgi:hypothetical protein